MGVVQQADGEYQPVCNDCGLALCFTITVPEYKRTKSFWENWRCVYCNKYAIGSFARWLSTNNQIEGI